MSETSVIERMGVYLGRGGCRLTQWVTATQLRLLRVFALKLISNAVQQLNVALIRVLLQAGDEGPRHSACGFAGDRSVRATTR